MARKKTQTATATMANTTAGQGRQMQLHAAYHHKPYLATHGSIKATWATIMAILIEFAKRKPRSTDPNYMKLILNELKEAKEAAAAATATAQAAAEKREEAHDAIRKAAMKGISRSDDLGEWNGAGV
ncbi:hypothetical protein GGF32_006581 [Allomyces javanicus]|nr:hypothetical protein GGF32_006581 [Allomyces javanicus]